MAKSRAEREAEFRAEHGISSGAYYEMRRKAASRGISPKTFDAVARESRYNDAKLATQLAKDDPDKGRHHAAITTGLIASDTSFADFYDALDFADIPDDFDWWYH